MSKEDKESLEEFSDRLRRMANPSVVEGSEELFYQFGWEAANASRTKATQRTINVLRPFAFGLVSGIAAMIALTFNTGQPVLDVKPTPQKIAITSSDRNPNHDSNLTSQGRLRPRDELESLLALFPARAIHGLSIETGDWSALKNSNEVVPIPENQSLQTFRQELMKEMKL